MAEAGKADVKSFTFYWIIKNLRYHALKEGRFLSSPSFTLPQFRDTTWHLELYPKGNEYCSVVSLYLFREKDNGPETVDIEYEFRAYPYTSKSGKALFRKSEPCGFEDFLPQDLKIEGEKSLLLECNMCLISTTLREGSCNSEHFLPLNLKSNDDQISTSIEELKVQASVQADKIKEDLFAWPTHTVAQSKFCVYSKIIKWPILVDDSFLSNEVYNQLIPVISSQCSLPLVFNLKRNGDFMSVDIRLENHEIKKALTLICKLSLFIDEVEFVMLFEEVHEFEMDGVDVWHLDKAFNVSELKKKLKKVLPVLAKWKFEFKFGYGEVDSEILNEEYDKDKMFSDDHPVRCPQISNQTVQFYNEGKFCDVAIRVQNKTIQAHKVVLSVMSPVFSAMFSTDMKENNKDVVDIVDLDEDVVRDMIFFIYTGTVKNLDFSRAEKLFSAADFYMIRPLMDICRNAMIKFMNKTNVCQILSFASMRNDLKLETVAVEFIRLHKKQVLKSPEWKQYEKEHVTSAIEILRSLCLSELWPSTRITQASKELRRSKAEASVFSAIHSTLKNISEWTNFLPDWKNMGLTNLSTSSDHFN